MGYSVNEKVDLFSTKLTWGHCVCSGMDLESPVVHTSALVHAYLPYMHEYICTFAFIREDITMICCCAGDLTDPINQYINL